MKKFNSTICGFILIWFTHTAFAADYQAKVIHIADGDTITVLNDQHEEIKIRLNGIDCPEKAQAYGNKAKEFTKDLVALQMVTIISFDKDRYGRTIGDVILEDGRNLSQELIKAGYAWWYRKYAPGNLELEKLEREAREAKLGLWRDPNPVPPWSYRKLKRGEQLGVGDIPDFSGSSERGPPGLGESPNPPQTPLLLPILGNRRSHIYHRPDCPNYDDIAKRNQVPFESAQDAEDAAYKLAGNCPH